MTTTSQTPSSQTPSSQTPSTATGGRWARLRAAHAAHVRACEVYATHTQGWLDDLRAGPAS